ncbi:RHS repeat-associated core domain-containing protein, partial [Segetibacter sp. 3557_3]|uniref:RHS repeat-associated core domain-containing protein n=1 Tax=Segetibacter sp. 3557_3 TaxID=2547429 RepID=UPI001404D38A
IEVYNGEGERTWAAEYDIYGRIRTQLEGKAADCPFRYQGQYEDQETGLYYNRFRYYSPDEGTYLSQDPIGLAGGMQLYGYVGDTCKLLDVFGLAPGVDVTTFYHAGREIIGSIDLSRGRLNLDFNPGGQRGFYVTDDLKQAQDWLNPAKGRTAITQFNIPKGELIKLNIKVFEGPTSEWEDFVTKGRLGTLQHNFDAVAGPMVRNPGDVLDYDAKPISKGSQLALFSKEAAALFDKYKTRSICR